MFGKSLFLFYNSPNLGNTCLMSSSTQKSLHLHLHLHLQSHSHLNPIFTQISLHHSLNLWYPNENQAHPLSLSLLPMWLRSFFGIMCLFDALGFSGDLWCFLWTLLDPNLASTVKIHVNCQRVMLVLVVVHTCQLLMVMLVLAVVHTLISNDKIYMLIVMLVSSVIYAY